MKNLTESDFNLALIAFEAMLSGISGAESFEQQKQYILSKVEQMNPGFTADYYVYKNREKNKIEYFKRTTFIREDGGFEKWYDGPNKTKGVWPKYRDSLSLSSQAIQDIDDSTSQILSRCANPRGEGDKRKGLVLGYVQSGKTANFQALIAKAVDAGYRIIIVLAGMHNNLRAQTQTRLQADLNLGSSTSEQKLAWLTLTSDDTDMPKPKNMHAQLNSYDNVAVMVVKKNISRLQNVHDFLTKVNPDVLRRRPVLIIDDESDQATPNTQKSKEAVSAINQRIRDIWKAVNVGTYVAYTATPFANVLIDPNDKDDLYPEDFIVGLPKPDGYLGADKFFNTSSYVSDNDDEEENELVMSLSNSIPEEEAQILAPRGRNLDTYHPETTVTLERAIYWFALATAIREQRTGERKHSSMLVHTSHYVDAHTALQDVINDFVRSLHFDFPNHIGNLKDVFDDQVNRAKNIRDGEREPIWNDALIEATKGVIQRITVKVDNGVSTDRLSYPDNEPQTVIAIGGGTLSRGLTLEGLVVSYFLRTSNTYDTLLQMGRWFGFRPRYADLVRVWVGPGLLDEYRHLAQVERQIRDEIDFMQKENKTPRELALKILAHPGRLDITSPSKMSVAQIVKAGLSGTRKQTIYLNREEKAIRQSHQAVKKFVANAEAHAKKILSDKQGNHLIQSVDNDSIVDFFSEFWVADRWIKADALSSWLGEHGENTHWDIVLISGRKSSPGEFSYSNDLRVKTVSRAPRKADQWDKTNLGFESQPDADLVNIRALLSANDSTMDFKILDDYGRLTQEDGLRFKNLIRSDAAAVKSIRNAISPNTGLIILYAIDKDSAPQTKSSATRENMDAPDHLIGVGVVFPNVQGEDPNDYVSVAYALNQPINIEEDDGDDLEAELLTRDENDETQ